MGGGCCARRDRGVHAEGGLELNLSVRHASPHQQPFSRCVWRRDAAGGTAILHDGRPVVVADPLIAAVSHHVGPGGRHQRVGQTIPTPVVDHTTGIRVTRVSAGTTGRVIARKIVPPFVGRHAVTTGEMVPTDGRTPRYVPVAGNAAGVRHLQHPVIVHRAGRAVGGAQGVDLAQHRKPLPVAIVALEFRRARGERRADIG